MGIPIVSLGWMTTDRPTGARDSEWQWHQRGHMQIAPRLRQITMPGPQHSVFYRPDALPAAQPTASKHCRHRCMFLRQPNCRPVTHTVLRDHCQILPVSDFTPSDFTYVLNYRTSIFPVLGEGRRDPRGVGTIGCRH